MIDSETKQSFRKKLIREQHEFRRNARPGQARCEKGEGGKKAPEGKGGAKSDGKGGGEIGRVLFGGEA